MAELSPRELCSLAGCSPTVLTAAALRPPDRVGLHTTSARELARVLGVSLDYLIAGLGRAPSRARVRRAVARARAAHARAE